LPQHLQRPRRSLSVRLLRRRRRLHPRSNSRQEMQTRLLREAEEARLNALEAANRREQEDRVRAAEETRRAAEARKTGDAAPSAPEAPAAPVEAPAPAVEAPAEVEAPVASAAEPADEANASSEQVQTAPRRFTPVAPIKRAEPAPKKPTQMPRDKGAGDRRQAGKLTVSRALNEDEGARARSLAALKRAREKEKRRALRRAVPACARSRSAMSWCPKASPCRNWPTAWPKRPPIWSSRSSRWA